jgi:succinate dehydrogenase/fumarate reductase flavoprotein subunit
MAIKEHILETDVLVIGGGLGGCLAAIKASDAGVSVVLMEKAALKRSGNAATGLHRIPLIHPDYNMSWEDFAVRNAQWGEIVDEDLSYFMARDSQGIVDDLEEWGIKVRQDDGTYKFEMAPDIVFPEKVVIYPPEGESLKPKLAQQVKKRGVKVLERTMLTSLLTVEGSSGKKVAGATGLNTRTGDFVVVKANAVVVTTGGGYRTYRHPDSSFASTRNITAGCPTNVGEGTVAAFRAGAEILNMELWKQSPVWKDFEHWGVGPVAYLHGSKVIDYKGDPLYPSMDMKKKMATWIQAEQLAGKGPIYYDLTYLDEDKIKEKEEALRRECEAYFIYLKARGLDLKKTPLEFEYHSPYLHNSQAGISIDHNGGATLEGLYAAGDCQGGGWRYSCMGAFVFGARGGKHAAQYAKESAGLKIDEEQVQREKERVYAPLAAKKDGVEPLELEDKIRHIVSDYAGFLRNEGKLTRGLERLSYFRENFVPKLEAKDNRDLVRSAEISAIFDMAEMHLRAALFRTESRYLPVSVHCRIDYPETDNENWLKHTVLAKENGEVKLTARTPRKLADLLKEVDVDAC